MIGRVKLAKITACGLGVLLVLGFAFLLPTRLPPSQAIGFRDEVAAALEKSVKVEVLQGANGYAKEDTEFAHRAFQVEQSRELDKSQVEELDAIFQSNLTYQMPFIRSRCWDPHHALRFTLDGGETVYIGLCFECSNLGAGDARTLEQLNYPPAIGPMPRVWNRKLRTLYEELGMPVKE